MKKIDEITQYVSDLFDRYYMSTYGFLSDYDEETDSCVEVPLFRTGEIDDETLTKISVHFGITKDEIVNTDENAATRYWDKYPFFYLYHKYMHAWEWNQHFKDPEPEDLALRMLNAIFSENGVARIRERYDFSSINGRLIEQLKEYDKIVPGTYHKGAKITDLRVSTQTIFSFPECPEMVRSFLDMVNRYKALFFKAIEQDLCEEEINELNFLSTWLVAKDSVLRNTQMTYCNILCFREIYQKENLESFYDYVAIDAPFCNCCPWRCLEFFDDLTLVQEYVAVYPWAKSKMRDFGMDLKNFCCDFVWSDAKPITYSNDEEAELADIEDACGLKHTPIEERAKERTRIYVKKTRSETYGWGSYIKTLKKACGPVSRGGIPVRSRSVNAFYVERMIARLNAKSGGIANG